MRKSLVVWMLSVVFRCFHGLSGFCAGEPSLAAAPAGARWSKTWWLRRRQRSRLCRQPMSKQRLTRRRRPLYLDVRDPNEYSAGHLPGADQCFERDIGVQYLGQDPRPERQDLCVLQNSGRSTLATKTLNDLGYKNAVLMDAQFEDWIKAGYPVER